MKYAIIAVVIAFVCAVQSALAAPPTSLPSGVKASAPKQKTYAPPVMNEVKPKSVQPVQIESAYEQGSQSAAEAEEPEAHQPLEPAGNAASVAPVVLPEAPKQAAALVGSPAPKAEPKRERILTPPAAKHVVEKETEIELEQDDDGEVEIEAETEIKLAPAPRHKAARKFDEDSYQFSDEELGISQYLKPKAGPPAPKTRARVQNDDDKPLVELPEPIDGYSPEYQEGKNLQDGEQPEEGAQDEGTVMIAEHKKAGTLGFEMDTVDMLQDSIEPTGDVSEIAKRK